MGEGQRAPQTDRVRRTFPSVHRRKTIKVAPNIQNNRVLSTDIDSIPVEVGIQENVTLLIVIPKGVEVNKEVYLTILKENVLLRFERNSIATLGAGRKWQFSMDDSALKAPLMDYFIWDWSCEKQATEPKWRYKRGRYKRHRLEWTFRCDPSLRARLRLSHENQWMP